MEPIPLLILLLACGAVLLVGELLLPTHGVLAFAGLGFFAGAILVVFQQSKWTGLGIILGIILLSPLLASWTLHLWTKSPIGRRVILQPLETKTSATSVTLGQVGTAATDLRPMGECDFGEQRMEAASELGIIPAGTKVKVIDLSGGRPTVRAIET